MPKSYMKFEVPKDLSDKVLQAIEAAKNTGKVRKGTNESTKAIEKGEAKLLAIAGDVEPQEIVMHLPPLCDEKKVPYVYVPSKAELGRAAGLDVPSAAICIADAGEGKELLKEVVVSIEKLMPK
ncbi:MAG: 50S ribosomal protein L7ae [Candidatus Aenigmarchaeota archaeon]|nr:50S ribosomal protein L7ae [Candidatus Aenigmarchaeota archaeon]